MKLKLTTVIALLTINVLSQLAISYWQGERTKNSVEAKLMRMKPVITNGRCFLLYLPEDVDFK
ncbi:MAG: hypothetical protein BMS9Abin31_0136 [Gammaproteobacteria bacterium]|nr:MAG: hypothetical protein BMS9Abin31_0136 [Gammaproteobacteria bacterium]